MESQISEIEEDEINREARKGFETEVKTLLEMSVTSSDDSPESVNMRNAIETVLVETMMNDSSFREEVGKFLELKEN